MMFGFERVFIDIRRLTLIFMINIDRFLCR